MTVTFRTAIAPAVLAATLFAGAAKAETPNTTINDLLALQTDIGYRVDTPKVDVTAEVAAQMAAVNKAIAAEEAGLVSFETPLGTQYCQQGEVYVTQEDTGFLGIGAKTIDYGCMPKAQYQQMLANYHNRPRNTYVPGNTGGGTKVCSGTVGMYGQVFASCH